MLEVAIHHHHGLRKKWQIIEVNKENVIPLLHLPWAWVMKLASHTQRSIQVWGIVSQSLLLHSYNLSTILAYATRSPSPSKFNNSFEAVLPPRNPPAEDQFCLCSHLILSCWFSPRGLQKNQPRGTPNISMHLTNNWTNSGAKHTEHIYNHDVRFG